MSLIGKGREGSGRFYKLTRAGKLRKSGSPYTCGYPVKRGGRWGKCHNTVRRLHGLCHLHRGKT